MGSTVCESARQGSAEVQIRLGSASSAASYINRAGRLYTLHATSLNKASSIIYPGSPLEVLPPPHLSSLGELSIWLVLLSPYPVITSNSVLHFLDH